MSEDSPKKLRRDRAELWVVPLGHSGSTLMIQVLNQCGWNPREVADITEDGPVTDVNGKLARLYFGAPAPWFQPSSPSKTPHPPPDDYIQLMKDCEFLPVVKDPHFSWTLPLWIQYAPEKLPPAFLFLGRDTIQCALSWARPYPALMSSTLSAVRERERRMDAAATQLRASERPGYLVETARWPDSFAIATERNQLYQSLTRISQATLLPEIPRPRFDAACARRFDPSKVHVYDAEGDTIRARPEGSA